MKSYTENTVETGRLVSCKSHFRSLSKNKWQGFIRIFALSFSSFFIYFYLFSIQNMYQIKHSLILLHAPEFNLFYHIKNQ